MSVLENEVQVKARNSVSVEGSKERAPRRQKSKVERLKAKENRRYSQPVRSNGGESEKIE